MAAAVIAVLFCGAGEQTNAQGSGKCDLTVRVFGFKNNRGNVHVGLWNRKGNWMNNSKIFQGKVRPISRLRSIVRFKNIPYGSYAIAVFHDENKNGKHDTNFIGIPREGYAFSNKAKVVFGPPGFEKAKFTINRPKMLLRIRIINVR